ncbi:hypothetical protein DPMN_066803 [Dreissena polymorpha]|uniref:Uncharacterized protein n=1 Tax=Dreissena polymorpha TaxID=45954 RepID=A0A9D3YZ52_DREPO|nr:hypothetical protein DPMN_066803 [Dreissena polymorpha]
MHADIVPLSSLDVPGPTRIYTAATRFTCRIVSDMIRVYPAFNWDWGLKPHSHKSTDGHGSPDSPRSPHHGIITDQHGSNTESTRYPRGLSRESYGVLRTSTAETRIVPDKHGIYTGHHGPTRHRHGKTPRRRGPNKIYPEPKITHIKQRLSVILSFCNRASMFLPSKAPTQFCSYHRYKFYEYRIAYLTDDLGDGDV